MPTENEAIEIATGNGDFVADCIDSIFYKVMLIESCVKHHKNIISSMGAGGRLDASKVGVVKMEKIGDRRYHLIATRDIDEGEEITVEYTLYHV